MKINLKISPKKIIKYLRIVIFIVAVSAVLYTAVYLYNNFYVTITQSQSVILSDEKISIDTINIKKFDAVIKNIENKTNTVPYSNIKNIFR